MIYELFLEGELADIRQDLGMQLNFNIDDINKYGSRDTSFSKTIVLPGTAKNNKLLGFVGELGSFNTYTGGGANINSNFNPAQTTKAELRANGLLLLKGVFRLTGIVRDRGMIEYEGNLFGELGGFIAAIGRGKLENLDFSEYDHVYTYNNIVNSWDFKDYKNVNGSFIISLFGPDKIEINNSFNFNFSTGQIITIINSSILQNNKSYTIASYTFLNNISTIFVNESINTGLLNDNFIIEYPSNIPTGRGYCYPLIDYGTYSNQKIDYDYRTFRPALFVKEYIDKIFEGSGYTYESNFFDSAFFKKLIIPNNQKELRTINNRALQTKTSVVAGVSSPYFLYFDVNTFPGDFTTSDGYTFTYNGSSTFKPIINLTISGAQPSSSWSLQSASAGANIQIKIVLRVTTGGVTTRYGVNGNNSLTNYDYNLITSTAIFTPVPYYNVSNSYLDVTISNGTQIAVEVYFGGAKRSVLAKASLDIFSQVPISSQAALNDQIFLNDSLPKNILQKDFFTWIIKMFNLYITEDKVKEKNLLIEPYVDYYDLTEYVDWTYKVSRDKPWQIKPMGLLTSRFYEYKYKEDTDFYNEGYKKKYNQPYGTSLEDTRFQFAKDKQTLEVGFSPSVLVEYSGRDKIVSALYKKSKGGSVDQEELTETNIRILLSKKITGVSNWFIKNANTNLGSALTSYGYAGHFDDPVNPTVDINFAAAQEIYCDPVTYPTNNLFNDYWSAYIAEIADKDSKILTCHVYLTDLDIAQLDFSKPVFIDGVLWRINKIIDFDASSGELTKVELLKIIDTSYDYNPCTVNWEKSNYDGTQFRNGDTIPQVTDPTAWANLTTPAWCYYNNNSANEATYGKLYNWYAINDPRGFAPNGYRVATDEDWTTLVNCLGGENVAGGKLKSTTGWASPNTGATNESLFNALPGGLRLTDGSFGDLLDSGFWWSSTEKDNPNAFYRTMYASLAAIGRSDSSKKFGFSVRLIKE